MSAGISITYTILNKFLTCLNAPVESAVKIEGFLELLKMLVLQVNYSPPIHIKFNLTNTNISLMYTCNNDFPSESTKIGYTKHKNGRVNDFSKA